ncbi:Pentatricopeptide repeat-containing protein [Rhynchospora pubera]|uniref:Pentatricopeptide repeat-containing protein n=1 Tax=Rhynchospora pubera TaxID=906938 RepID=A0AAV8CAA2_9POAL|nr:Pentatricopeptide repeat-containing protein [Rhynchospora pubera]
MKPRFPPIRRLSTSSSPSTSSIPASLPVPHRTIPSPRGQDLDFITVFHSHLINSCWPQLLPLAPSLTPFRLLHLFLLLRPDPTLSLSFYNWAHLHHPSSISLPALSVLLHTLSQSRRLKSAHSLLSSSLFPTSAISCFDLFHSLLHTYRVCCSTPQVFDLLFSAYARQKKFRAATDVFLLMKDYGFLPNIRSCNAFLSSLLSMGRTDIVLSFYKEMRQARISANVYTLNMVMTAYCNLGKLEKAMDLFGKMETLGFSPTVISFNILIDAHCKNGQLSAAARLLKSMKGKGLDPNVVTYNTLINGFCSEGRLHEANKILNEMNVSMVTPSTVTYNILISGYCKANNSEMAFRLFEEMVEKGVEVDIVTYNSLILGFCNEGKTKKAASLVKELDAGNLKPNGSTYAALVIGQCQRKNSERAYQIFKAMKKNGFEPRVEISEILISTFCKNGDYEGAVEVLKEMLERCFAPSNALLDELFEGIYDARKTHLVDKLRSEISNVRLIPETYFHKDYRKADQGNRCKGQIIS